ncbi:hypothetical protein WR25_05986 [Diploscapter pachys]|uniref:Uncharacterized protein n=1 Tax=Diploscapter pachys TaxID=2018661 RepID=A0A2A2LQ74_9BILA|nr:hypothetical protein WR25_05986 [Diploscapter pachys]
MQERCRILVEVPVELASNVEIYLRSLQSISHMSCNRSIDNLAVSILEHHDIPAKESTSAKIAKRDKIFYYVEHGPCTTSHMIAEELNDCTVNFVYSIKDFFKKYTLKTDEQSSSSSNYKFEESLNHSSVNSILESIVKREEQMQTDHESNEYSTASGDRSSTQFAEPDSSLFYDIQRSATVYANETLNESETFDFDHYSPQDESNERRHRGTKTGHELKKGYIQCKMCNLVLKGTNLYDHAKSHYTKVRFTCTTQDCTYASPFRSCISRHTKRIHGITRGGFKDNWTKADFKDYGEFAESLEITI